MVWKFISGMLRRQGPACAQRRRQTAQRPRSWRPILEVLERRLAPAVTSMVSGGVLTITGTFNDAIVVTASTSFVQVDGANPNSGAAASNSITQIVVNGGSGSNVIDLSNLVPTSFSLLTSIHVNGGVGQDTFIVNNSFNATLDSGNQPDTLELTGTADSLTINPGAATATFDNGVVISFPHRAGPIQDNVHAANLTFLVSTGSNYVISDDGTPNDDFSRVENLTSGLHTDFLNPTSALNFQDNSNGTGNETFTFDGLDAVGRPANVVLNTNSSPDLVQFGGTYTNVVEDLANRVVHLDDLAVAIPNITTADVLLKTSEANLTIEPSAGNHRVLEASPTAGFSRAANASTGQFTDFLNPTGTLTVLDTNSSGGSIYEFKGLGTGTPPASIVLDCGTQADLVQIDGTYSNIVESLVNDTISLGGTIIQIPGTERNVELNTTESSLTIEPAAGTHRIIEASLTAGFSRSFNDSNNLYTDFINPTGTLTVKDTNTSGGSTYEFKGLGIGTPPANIVLDCGSNADLVQIDSSYSSVTEDLVNDTIILDSTVISIPGTMRNVELNTTETSLTIEPAAGTHRVLEPSLNPGFSRNFNQSNGLYTDFINPTVTLDIKDTNDSGGSIYEFMGLAPGAQPTNIILDCGNQPDLVKIDSTYGSVTEDLVHDLISLDSMVISIPGTMRNVELNTTETNLTIEPAAGSHRILEASPTDGFSRNFNASNGLYTDFINPTGTLDIKDTNSTGGSIYEFKGLGNGRPPASIVLDCGSNADLVQIDGTYSNITEDLANDTINLDGTIISIPGTMRNVELNTTETSLTIEPAAGTQRIIEASPLAGFTRSFNQSNGLYTDFINPTSTLTVLDTNNTGGSTYEFKGLGAGTTPPASIVLNCGNQPDLVEITGAYTNVVESLANDTIDLDGTVVSIPGTMRNVELDTTETNLTIEPAAGTHRIIEASPTAGFSRSFNQSNGLFTDFINPTGTLTVKDTNTTGGSTYEFEGLGTGTPPAGIVLDCGGQADLVKIDGPSTNVVESLVNDTISLDSTVISIPGTMRNVELNTTETNLTIEPAAGTHRVIEASPTAGFTRSFNASNNLYTDFINPSGTLTIKDTNSAGGSIYEFEGLGTGTPPASIVFDCGTQADLVQIDSNFTNVVESLVNDTINLDGMIVSIPGNARNVELNTTETNLTIEPAAGTHRIIEASSLAGFSRSFNDTNNLYTDFINPSGTLTVKDTNSTGGSIYEFKGLGTGTPPASIVFDCGSQSDLVQIDGIHGSITEDLVHDTISVDNTVISIPGTMRDVELNTIETNLTIEPAAGTHRVIEASPNAGFSRSFNASNNLYTDFINPSGTLTVKDINSTGGSTYEFEGLGIGTPPASIVFDAGSEADLVQIDGTFTNVVESLVNDTINLDNTVISIPGTAHNVELNTTETNLTILPAAGTHRIIEASPNAGFSRSFNASNDLFTDFLNPTGTLTVQDTNSTGGSLYEFQGLGSGASPAAVDLIGGQGTDSFAVTPSVTVPINVIGGLPAGTSGKDSLVVTPGTATGVNLVQKNATNGQFTFADRQPVTFTDIATVSDPPSIGTTTSSPNMSFVENAYETLLGRAADQAGLTFWTNLLNGGGSRTAVALGLLNSTEYETNAIDNLYQTILHRTADSGGLNSFLAVLANGGSLQQVQIDLLSSQEYFNVEGGGTAAGFENAVYQAVLGRAIDTAGLSLASQLGTSAASTVPFVTAVVEGKEADQDFVTQAYLTILGRAADSMGLAYFTATLQAGASQSSVLASLTASDEYFAKA